MALETVGLLHPGEMGAAVGAALREQGHRVVWAAEGEVGVHWDADDAVSEEMGAFAGLAMGLSGVLTALLLPLGLRLFGVI